MDTESIKSLTAYCALEEMQPSYVEGEHEVLLNVVNL